MVTVGIYKLSSNSAMYEHRCLENINKLYTSAGKFNHQEQYKAILDAEMVSNTEIFIHKSPMSPVPSVTIIHTSARKTLCLFTKTIGCKKENCCPPGRLC